MREGTLVRAHLCASERKRNSKFLSANYKAASSITNWHWEAEPWELKPSKFKMFFMGELVRGGGALPMSSCPGTAPAHAWVRMSCCGEGALPRSRVPGRATGLPVLTDGLFFDAVDYNLSRVWPLVGPGLDELLINRGTGCCL